MAYLKYSIGDYQQYQLTVTKAGLPVDLTGVLELNFYLQASGGAPILQTWTLAHGVAVQSPASAGIAILTVLPTDTLWATTEQTCRYSWSLIDALGNPTLNLENGVFQLVLPP